MNKTQKNTILLIKAAILEERPQIEQLSETEWKSVYAFAKEQGVSALCYKAISQLTKEQQPPKNILLQWALLYKKIVQRSQYQRLAAQKLWEESKNIGINFLILKGLSIAQHYPTPELRECGDIDIYCFENHDKLNQWVESQGISVDYKNKRHSIFTIHNTVVENHSYFLYNRQTPDELALENLLVAEAKKCLQQNPDSLLFGTPLGIAVFFLKHAEKHFVFDRTNIQLRSLCDWAILLKSNTLQYSELKKVIAGNTVERFADMMTFLCVELFGLSKDLCTDLKPFPEKVMLNAKHLILNYQHQKEERGTFSGRVKRFVKYIKYHRTYKSILGKDIIKWYYFS